MLTPLVDQFFSSTLRTKSIIPLSAIAAGNITALRNSYFEEVMGSDALFTALWLNWLLNSSSRSSYGLMMEDNSIELECRVQSYHPHVAHGPSKTHIHPDGWQEKRYTS